MTKEELEKEAEEWLRKYLLCCNCEKKCNCIDSNSYCEEQVLKSYLAGAEPREKRIAELEDKLIKKVTLESLDVVSARIKELEKENAELKNKLEHRNCLDCSNHSSKLRMRTLELEKENAELKVSCKIQVDTAFQMIEEKDEQLTKAKELLTKILQRIPDFKANSIKDLSLLNALSEAEQFLKERNCTPRTKGE